MVANAFIASWHGYVQGNIFYLYWRDGPEQKWRLAPLQIHAFATFLHLNEAGNVWLFSLYKSWCQLRTVTYRQMTGFGNTGTARGPDDSNAGTYKWYSSISTSHRDSGHGPIIPCVVTAKSKEKKRRRKCVPGICIFCHLAPVGALVVLLIVHGKEMRRSKRK